MEYEKTSYDTVSYPSTVHPTATPDHLAAIARLHGLEAADPRQARVLEIAGGDGLNTLALAAAYPHAQFVNIDLAASAIARGETLRRAAGLSNARMEVLDIVHEQEHARLEGPFDYVIAHGLYAWVPPAVQAAMWQLIARVLAPEGIAFVSFNAMPGGRLRQGVRDMMLFEVEGLTDPEERLARAVAFLEAFSPPRENDDLALAALRRTAAPMLEKNPQTLFHDELNEFYDPKTLTEVVAAAQSHGLAYLNETQGCNLFNGLPGTEMDDASVVRQAQRRDFECGAYFHRSLFIRQGRHPRRVLSPEALEALLFSAPRDLRRIDETRFARKDQGFEIEDDGLARFLGDLVDHAPARQPIAPLVTSPDHAETVLHMIDRAMIVPHALPYPGAIEPGERPLANGLVRAMVAQGRPQLATLDHSMILLTEEPARRFLSLLDGQSDRAAIEAACRTDGLCAPGAFDTALHRVACAGLLSA